MTRWDGFSGTVKGALANKSHCVLLRNFLLFSCGYIPLFWGYIKVIMGERAITFGLTPCLCLVTEPSNTFGLAILLIFSQITDPFVSLKEQHVLSVGHVILLRWMAAFGDLNLEDDVLFEELWRTWIIFPWLQICQARSSLHSQVALKHCGIRVAGDMDGAEGITCLFFWQLWSMLHHLLVWSRSKDM